MAVIDPRSREHALRGRICDWDDVPAVGDDVRRPSRARKERYVETTGKRREAVERTME